MPPTATNTASRGSLRALEGANFFLADVQTGLGPFVAAYLAASGWAPDRVGQALTFAAVVSVVLQSPAGWIVDRVTHKRAILVVGTAVLACGATLLALRSSAAAVFSAQALIGIAAPFLGPTLAAITLGLVGRRGFDRQFGRNQGFNSAGNLFAAVLIAGVSHLFGNRAIFAAAALLALPTIVATLRIRGKDIDPELARGGGEPKPLSNSGGSLKELAQGRVLLLFLLCAFLFHLANAAMLPQLGELLAHGSVRAAAPFMSACIAVTQTVIMVSAAAIGRFANTHGRKGLLLLGFGVLPLRALLYTVLHGVAALLAVQVLDGVANAIFAVVSILVVADCTRGTGRFNFAQGALATAVGLGAGLSTTLGGVLMAHHGYRISFLALGAVACAAFLVLLFAIPETEPREPHRSAEPHPQLA